MSSTQIWFVCPIKQTNNEFIKIDKRKIASVTSTQVLAAKVLLPTVYDFMYILHMYVCVYVLSKSLKKLKRSIYILNFSNYFFAWNFHNSNIFLWMNNLIITYYVSENLSRISHNHNLNESLSK